MCTFCVCTCEKNCKHTLQTIFFLFPKWWYDCVHTIPQLAICWVWFAVTGDFLSDLASLHNVSPLAWHSGLTQWPHSDINLAQCGGIAWDRYMPHYRFKVTKTHLSHVSRECKWPAINTLILLLSHTTLLSSKTRDNIRRLGYCFLVKMSN